MREIKCMYTACNKPASKLYAHNEASIACCCYCDDHDEACGKPLEGPITCSCGCEEFSLINTRYVKCNACNVFFDLCTV